LANGQGQTNTLNYEISTMWETKPRTTSQKTSLLFMGPEHVTRPNPTIYMMMMILCQCFLKPDLLEVHVVFRNEALVTELWQYNPFKSDVFKMLVMVLKQVIT
jgi:hypothetical protein